jgi:dihydrofolate synthase/folylpolyglutamate synthase
MPDFATSTSPQVQRQLDRLWALGPGADTLGLGTVTALLARLGDPHLALPPVLHVAGTNGKGSTCAFLRAAVEAAGFTAHVYSSPHLVRFNERIRVAGRLIGDDELAPLLEEVLDKGGDLGASFFEVTTAAAFLAFARTPADACIIEVGLGGRLDATNVVRPVATAIAQLGIDHQAFLGDTIEAIAGEKAGIAKPGVPLVTMHYAASPAARVAEAAAAVGSPLLTEGDAWRYEAAGETLRYTDAWGTLETPLPALAGPHQPGNLALAIAMLRHQSALALPASAYAEAATVARWPARMQRLSPGPLTDLLPPGSQLWLDGGHNPAAGAAVAAALRDIVAEAQLPCDLILGMLANKDPRGLLEPIAPLVGQVTGVPTPGHEHHSPAALAEIARGLGVAEVATAADVPAALGEVARSGARVVLILGSLYLAGTVLEANGELPD